MIRLLSMNDTNNIVLSYFEKGKSYSSSEIHARSGRKTSLVTIKRSLSNLLAAGYLARIGAGRSIRYTLERKGLLLRTFDVDTYLGKPQQDRIMQTGYNHHLFELPPVTMVGEQENEQLDSATESYRNKANENSDVRKRELERFVVEMSWKSARIEGNTYTLLDTEQLLLYGIKSPKNTEFEVQMLLGQKAAFTFVYENLELWHEPSVSAIEKIQELAVSELGVARNLRQTVVGITGTEYVPLGNAFQIREALEQLLVYVNAIDSVYEKALMVVLGMSYIQPFADGNKRTARLLANGVLLANGYAPISYRAVDETAYKEATLIFYEQNSIVPFKQLFIDQYIYSATHYNIAAM
ncbi:Fic family protein [Candidatus Saccharibacteria bacterium]|nr:MAG: Fic family protein [Candidatus Saccharibacteria bacterium]